MSKKSTKTNLTKDIMKQIKSDDVSMKSSQYYLLLTIAMIGAGFLFMALATLAVSLLTHDDRVGQDLRQVGAPSQSNRWAALIAAVIIAAAGFLGAYVIFKKFRLGYKNSTVVLLSLMLAVLVVSALLFVQSGLASQLSTRTPFKPLAPYSNDLKNNHAKGLVISVDGETIIILDRSRMVEIEVRQVFSTNLVGGEEVMTGDTILIKGKSVDGVIEAEVIIINPIKNKFRGINPKYEVSGISPRPAL